MFYVCFMCVLYVYYICIILKWDVNRLGVGCDSVVIRYKKGDGRDWEIKN